MPRAGRLDRVDFGEHLIVAAVLEHADVDDHVHLVRAVLHRVGGLKHLRLRRGIAGRKTDHRAHAHLVRFILHIRLAARDIAGRDAHRRRVVFHRVVADGLDLRPRRFGLEQRMIHHREHLAEFHFLFLLHVFLQNGKPRRRAEKTASPASNRRVSDRFHLLYGINGGRASARFLFLFSRVGRILIVSRQAGGIPHDYRHARPRFWPP